MMRVWLLLVTKVMALVLVFALAAPVILPFYSGLQIGLIRPFVSPDFALRLRPDGSIYVYYKNYAKPAVERNVTSFAGLGLLMALCLATPMPWRRRLARLGLSTLVLLGFHLVALWGLIAIWDAMFRSGGISFLMRWAYMVIASGDWLAPLASWAAVSLSAWRKANTSQHTSAKEGGESSYASV